MAMENKFITQLKVFLTEEDLLSKSREIGELKNDFDDWLLHSEGDQQVATLKAKDEGVVIEQVDYSIFKESFYLLFGQYLDAKKQQLAIKNKLEAENLKLKMSLIAELKALVENEENIGTAFNGYNSIQDTWKKIGDIPRAKRDSIQKDYSRLRELFFHNITIYKELKEHDYKRNTQLKEKVIVSLQKLRNECENVKELEKTLRIYQDEWEDVGPVHKDLWESLKSSYWEVVRSINDKINKHYEQHRVLQQENLKLKRAVLNDLKSFLEKISNNIHGQKDWNKHTAEVLNFQEAWKKIGFAPKKDNELIWKEFRALCDSFFSNKKAFYKSRDNKDKDAKAGKRALIEKAEALKSSEDWKEASHALIQLQKQWKTLQNAGRYEKKLWEEFRAACDFFFNKKQETSKAQDKLYVSNLASKREFIKGISAKNIATSEDVQLLIQAFNKLGAVPSKENNDLHKSFNKALKLQLESTEMDAQDIELLLFKARIDGLSNSEDAPGHYYREKKAIRLKITTLENDLLKAETNLGYFSVSKGAEKLFSQINENNAKTKDEIALLKRKIKLIPNE